mmetsp:Transcript_16868/g.51111  ORF Transcript_16868/g.51111 Transcript_16868/m.51111 type:complete len:89 (-) Transcript_16868:346-612(-)
MIRPNADEWRRSQKMAKMHFTQFTTLGLKTQYRAACARLLGPLDPGQRCLKQRVAENLARAVPTTSRARDGDGQYAHHEAPREVADHA